jgi:hypothetical protein
MVDTAEVLSPPTAGVDGGAAGADEPAAGADEPEELPFPEEEVCAGNEKTFPVNAARSPTTRTRRYKAGKTIAKR